jgi:hypothetical protein
MNKDREISRWIIFAEHDYEAVILLSKSVKPLLSC